MEIQLSPAQQAFAREAIAAGRLHHEEEVVQEALALWETRERARIELLASLDDAEVTVVKGRQITQHSMRELAETVKRRGRERLAGSGFTPEV